ncbi:hypothetical protein [Streptomyces sp. NBC_00162]|uniref:hypothetical protein n=1 Tax=Streptomyces sp. NBC_00162 TaxID=2903629 RepID=UPI00214B5CF4|nr:hypothetical protein [Streptomyces sp. NBC_00162]UUU37665.1 hypothetical protein JIW86_01275 [Streptomyces sp. NBC_00162]
MDHHRPSHRADPVLDPPLDLGHGPVLGLGQALVAAGFGDQRPDLDQERVQLSLHHLQPGQIRREERARITPGHCYPAAGPASWARLSAIRAETTFSRSTLCQNASVITAPARRRCLDSSRAISVFCSSV